jgi:type IV secretion system protein VirB9
MMEVHRQAPLDAPVDETPRPAPSVQPAAGVPVAAASLSAVAIPLAGPLGPSELLLLAEPVKKAAAVAPRPEEVILKANKEARMEPTADGYRVGTHLFPYMEGALYKLYAQPLRFSHIRLQPGETLSGDAVIGDPHRWKLVESVAGTGDQATAILMVMPLLEDLATTLTIVTNRHMYVFECVASKRAYMAHVGFTYAAEEAEQQARGKRQQQAEAEAAARPAGLTPLDLNTSWLIAPKDAKHPPAWTPVRAFSDATKLYIEFPATIGTTDLPALFVPVGKALEVINYRTATGKYGQTFFLVDGLPDFVELRVVRNKDVTAVRILKEERS